MSKRPIENIELYKHIGKQICEARYQYRVVGGIKKVMTQTQLANVCGVTFQQIQKYEKATNRVPLDKLIAIANATRKDLFWFLPKNTNPYHIERHNDKLQRIIQSTQDTNSNNERSIGTDEKNDVNN
tara:strand:- start:542 stop:922 length:381 start_codon:yes stop_codon:yes gene_type:complete